VSDNSTGEVRSKRLNPVSGLLEGSESVGGSWTAATTSVVNVGNGWYRLVLTATKNAGSGVITRIGMSDSSGNFGYNGDGTSYLMLSGVQINPGSVQSYISTSGSAYQAPRFDYDPTTLTPRGLLIEGQATNLLKYSNPIATTGSHWGLGGYTIGTGATSPDGTSTSSRFTVNSNSGAACSMQQSVTMNATSCTFSVWFKNGTLTGSSNSALTSIAIRNATTATILLRFYFNATNPSSITYVTGSTGASVVAYPNGWYRISATVTSGITSGNSITGYFAGLGGSVNDELNNYADWWGPQIEEGSGASSYIPTAASTVTRTADDCLLDNIATAFGFNASEGTILIRYGNRKSTGSNRSYTFLPASGTNNQIFEGSGTAFNVYSSGSFVAQIGTTNISGARLCAAYKLDDYAVSVNGGAVATDTSGAVPSSLTRLSIGGSIVNAAANNYGPISLFKYWPTRLPNAQLQSLTT
jgi:hypothetical protein